MKERSPLPRPNRQRVHKDKYAREAASARSGEEHPSTSVTGTLTEVPIGSAVGHFLRNPGKHPQGLMDKFSLGDDED